VNICALHDLGDLDDFGDLGALCLEHCQDTI